MPNFIAVVKIEAYQGVVRILKDMAGVTLLEPDDITGTLPGGEITIQFEAPEKPNIPGVKFYPSSEITFFQTDASGSINGTCSNDNLEKINRIWYKPGHSCGPKTFLVSEKLTKNAFVATEPVVDEQTIQHCGATQQAVRLVNSILALQGMESITVKPYEIQIKLASVFYWDKDGFAGKVAQLLTDILFPTEPIDIDNTCM